MWAGARCPAVALPQGGAPLPWRRFPGARLGDPYPPPCLRCVLYIPFPPRVRVSLSLQTRRVLARSSRPAIGEFRSLAPRARSALFYAPRYARCSHRGCLAALATAVRFFTALDYRPGE